MKKILASVLTLLILSAFCAFGASAHPDSFSSGEEGSVENLITIKKPDSASTATMKTTYSVTGVGKEGVSVCFYTYDGEKYVAQRNTDNTISSIKIGASGVLYRQIALKEGINRICVRAEASDGTYQLVYLSINVIKSDIMSGVGTFSFDMQSRYNGWLN